VSFLIVFLIIVGLPVACVELNQTMLPASDHDHIRRMHREGYSNRRIADILAIDRKTVAKTLSRRSTTKKPRAPSTEMKARRVAVRQAVGKKTKNGTGLVYPSCSAIVRYLAKQQVTASRFTVRRDLISMQYKSRVRRFVPSSNPGTLAKRVIGASHLLRIPLSRLVFSDESYVTCDNHTFRLQWVRCREDIINRQKQQRGSVPFLMVWACVGIGFKSKIVLFKRKKVEGEKSTYLTVPKMDSMVYRRKCLSPMVSQLKGKVLIQDGAKPHTAKATSAYMKRKGIEYFESWPAHSPDMNFIEHVWSWLKPAVAEKEPSTDAELAAAVEAAWDEIPQSKIDAMIQQKYREKLRRVVATKGRYN